MGRPLAGLALVLTVSVLLASCATDMGGPEGRDGPPGRGRAGTGHGAAAFQVSTAAGRRTT